jgi:predicted RNase H-like HicB family nuclease
MKRKHLFQVVVLTVSFCFSAAAWAGGGIGCDETRTGRLDPPSYQDSWTFDGNAGDRVVITTIGTSGGVVPWIYLYPPNSNDPEGSALGSLPYKRLDHQLLESGTYTILIQDMDQNTAGDYAITLAKIGCVTSPPILPAQTLPGTLVPSDTDMFQFAGNAGDRVVITARSAAAGLYPVIYLYPPGGGESEAYTPGSLPYKRLDHQLLQSGTYTILIQDLEQDTTGDYWISLAKIPGPTTSPTDPDGGPILPAQTLPGGLVPSDTDMFQFTGNAGDRVVITARSVAAGLYPVIYLYPPGGGESEANTPGSSLYKRLDHQLLQSGTYTILIQDLEQDTTGNYWISLAKIPGPTTSPTDPDGGTILPAQTLPGDLNLPSDTDMFQFTGNAGERVVITARGAVAGLYPVIYLYPPDGGESEANTPGSSLYKRLDHQLLQSGTYTILIQDLEQDTTGNYWISLAKIPGPTTSPTDPDGGPILPAETRTGNMNLPSDTDMFRFTGNVGDQVEIRAIGISGYVAPEIYLYPPGGAVFEDSATGSSTDKRLIHPLAHSGTYTILIQDQGLDSTGLYTIGLVKDPSTPGPGIYNPSPPEGVGIDDFSGNMSWDPVPGATGYDVYFGENRIKPLAKIGDNISSPSLAFPDMNPLTVYYWQVVAHTPGGDILGPVWWFKTGIPDCDGGSGGSGGIDPADLALFASGYGRSNCDTGPPCDGDLDFDYDVDGTDLAKLISRTNCRTLELSETFTSGAPGWTNDASGTWSVAGGVYQMSGSQGGAYRYSYYGSTFGNFTLEVDIAKVQGNVNSPAGILFRGDGTFANLYMFHLGTDGEYVIAKQVGGSGYTYISSTYSSAINKGLGVTNKLRVAAHGWTLQFYINEKVVNVVEDMSFTSGRVGLYAWDDASVANIMQFDNVKVYSIQTP